MADVFTKAKRSAVMAAIRSKGNRSTELKLVALFRLHGITGWRRHAALPGRPDFVFRRERLAIFVDGCFWHGCPMHCRRPKSRMTYWSPKIDRNLAKDRAVTAALKKSGWRVVRVWEHALKKPEPLLSRLKLALEPRVTSGRPAPILPRAMPAPAARRYPPAVPSGAARKRK